MLTGTLPVLGALRGTDRFAATATDPDTGDVLELGYGIEVLDPLSRS